MLTMTRTEAIPYASMKAGLPWDRVTYPEFLDSVERRPRGINLLAVCADGAGNDLGNGPR